MTEPLDEIQWKSPEWIQHFGLFTGNVMDYFSESPFYDRTSNNQMLRMQLQFQPPPANVNPQAYFDTKLKEMAGIEFVIAYVREPDFWVIRKQRRLDPENVVPKNDYYVIGANVYQAPKVYDVVSSRLLSMVLNVGKSMDTLNRMNTFVLEEPEFEDKPQATPAQATPAQQTPQTTSQPTTGGSMPAGSEISSAVFDNLLTNVLPRDSIYLDDIPLYGKGSTVESLGLKLNPDT